MAPPSPCSIICPPAAREQRKEPSSTIPTTARPSPLPAPVTIAERPSSVPSGSKRFLSLVPQDDPRIEAEGTLREREQRVDLDLVDLWMLPGDARERRGRLGDGPHVERSTAACAGEERRTLQREDQLLCIGFVDRSEGDCDVAHDLRVQAAHPDERNRPEARIAARAHDQLDSFADRCRQLD